MIFSEVLEDSTGKIDGCLGIVVMGMDGIPIDKLVPAQPAGSTAPNFETLALECTMLLRTTKNAADEVGAGGLRELIFMADEVTVIAIAINAEYVVFGAIQGGASYGKARFVMKTAAMALQKEFV